MKFHLIVPLVCGLIATAHAEEIDPLTAKLDRLLGQPGGLTAESLAEEAVRVSYELEAVRQETRGAKAKAYEAVAGFIPQIVTRASYAKLSDFTPPPSAFPYPVITHQALAEAKVSVPISDYALKITQDYLSARYGARGAEENETAEKLQFAAQAKVTYYDWVRAQARQVVAIQDLTEAREQSRDVSERHRVGTVLLADVLQIKAREKNLELLLEKSNNLVDYTAEQIRILMQESDPQRTYAIGEDFRQPLPPLVNVADLKSLQAEALDRRFELRSFESAIAAQEKRIHVARVRAFPRLDLFAQDSYENPNERYFPPEDAYHNTWAAGGQVSWTLSDIPIGLAKAEGAKAKLARIKADRSALINAITLEVTNAFQDLKETQFAIASTAQALLAAEEAYRVRQYAFRVDKASYVELINSDTALTQARLAAINAQVDHRVARVRLVHAVGRDGI
jgi:outer membrane protein TolC